MLNSEIHRRDVFAQLLWSQSWEDPELDLASLALGPGDRLLVVTSGGCNALSLLTEGPREVVAIDMNGAQSMLLELKLAGIRALDHEEFLNLLGVRFVEEGPPRAAPAGALYRRLRDVLPDAARRFWDGRTALIERRLVNAGRYERHLARFRALLRLFRGGKVDDLLRQSAATQRDFYRERWDGRGWRLFFRIFFSRFVLGRGGLDPQFFRFVAGDPSFGDHWLKLAEHVLTELPVRENYFLAQICTGRYLHRRAVPRYLDPRRFDALKRCADRVRVVTDELERFLFTEPDASCDAFSMSNVFEWMDRPHYAALLQELWRVGRPGARLCYRNLLVHRERPAELAGRLRSHQAAARRLLPRDRSFVYSNFVLEEVMK